MKNNTLYVVHCIDTEGPMIETLEATFERLESTFGLKLDCTKENLKLLQAKKIPLHGKEISVAKFLSPNLLKYNENWHQIDEMLDEALSDEFRNKMLDDSGNGWVYSWHCLDHIDFINNPRHKDVGYGNIFRKYKSILNEKECVHDELNWHFHPFSIKKEPTNAATSFTNSYYLLNQILCRRIIEDSWFPTCNRPGFHAERPDSHMFLEQWIPFDYANQSHENDTDQPDLSNGRFGDWRRANKSWCGYNPSHDDYQVEGNCRRKIFRCLNVGTRFRTLKNKHVKEAFGDAQKNGAAILSFANHDYRDIRRDVDYVRKLLLNEKNNFADVKIRFSGAEKAASIITKDNKLKSKPKFDIFIKDEILHVKLIDGKLFGPQPFLAIKTKTGTFLHDNFDFQSPNSEWSYHFDHQTINLDAIDTIGVGSAGVNGGFCVKKIIVG